MTPHPISAIPGVPNIDSTCTPSSGGCHGVFGGARLVGKDELVPAALDSLKISVRIHVVDPFGMKPAQSYLTT